MTKSKTKKPIPFAFVMEELATLNPHTKPMFGCVAVYVGLKIVLILRQRKAPLYDDGIWIATTGEHHKSLKKDLPSMRSIKIFGPGPTGWQNLPMKSKSFEAEALKLCEMIHNNDPRVGKIPKGRPLKKQSKKKASKKP